MEQRVGEKPRFTSMIHAGRGMEAVQSSSLRFLTPGFVYPLADRLSLPPEYLRAVQVAARFGLCPDRFTTVVLDISCIHDKTAVISAAARGELERTFNCTLHVLDEGKLVIEAAGETAHAKEARLYACLDKIRALNE